MKLIEKARALALLQAKPGTVREREGHCILFNGQAGTGKVVNLA